MPVQLWQLDKTTTYSSKVVTDWDKILGGEEYRQSAEELDERLDHALDDALSRLNEMATVDAKIEFKRIWCVGRSVRESGILQLTALRTERRALLWRAMAWKCWLGTRHDYPDSALQVTWRVLRSKYQPEVVDKKGGVRDLFETGFWLQQQEIEDAAFTFGGSISNAREMGSRTSVYVPAMRDALHTWLTSLCDQEREAVHKGKNFVACIKALRRNWPDRGFGSARRPEHYAPDELYAEVRQVLGPVLTEIRETIV